MHAYYTRIETDFGNIQKPDSHKTQKIYSKYMLNFENNYISKSFYIALI